MSLHTHYINLFGFKQVLNGFVLARLPLADLCVPLLSHWITTPMAQLELTALRPWDDFFPGTERFSKPDFKDLGRWNNRVINNLLYYQTNYIAMTIVVFLLVG